MCCQQERAREDQELAELVEAFLYATRASTARSFSCLWQVLLDHLLLQREDAAVDVLTKHYVVSSTEGYEAPWRQGCDRMVPGLAGASQAQEAWHAHRLRPGLGADQSPTAVLDQLQKFFGARAMQVSRGHQWIYTTPALSWDWRLVEGLTLECTTSIKLFLQCARRGFERAWSHDSARVFGSRSVLHLAGRP